MLENDRLREKPCTHAGAIRDSEECLLVGGCDTDPRRCEEFSDAYGGTPVYTRLTELIEETAPDILHIATPTETHFDVMEAALSSEIKLLVCEKPLVEHSRAALKVANWQRQGRMRILLNHERRYSRDYLRAKRRISDKSLGEILSVSASLYTGGSAAVNAVLLHDGTHLIDIIQFLTGSDLNLISVYHSRKGRAGTLVITASSGTVPVTLIIGSQRRYIQFEVDISFDGGRIRIGNGLYEEYRDLQSPFYEKMRSLGRTGSRRPKITGYFSNMLADAVRCFRSRSSLPRSSAEEGLSVLRFIDAVEGKLKRGTHGGI
jgi:predicted dehydrogenase